MNKLKGVTGRIVGLHANMGANSNAGCTHSICIDRRLPHIDDAYIDTVFSDGELSIRRQLLEQVDEAFSTEPSLSGVIHGRRKIHLGRRGPSRPSLFPSRKNATGGLPAVFLPVESRPESVFALELERDPNVKAFRTQAIELALPGTKSPIFPDFLIVDMAGKLHVREVKADKLYLSLETKRRIEHLTIVFRSLGFSYAVIDTTEMPTGMKSANLFWLHKQFGSTPHKEQIDKFLSLDFQLGTYGQLRRRSKELGLDVSIVPYLLFIERLNTNWTLQIDDDSRVWK